MTIDSNILTYGTLKSYNDINTATSSSTFDSDLALSVKGGAYIGQGIKVDGEVFATKVHGAAWNDVADCIDAPDDTPLYNGCCYTYENGKYRVTRKYGEPCFGINSDTYGFSLGEKLEKRQLKIAISGFVLAFVDKIYKFGTPLTCTKFGKLTKARLFTRIFHPEKIIATFWKNETSQTWNNINVNGRKWVKIK